MKVFHFDCHDIFVIFADSAEQRPLESQRQLRDLSHLALARYHLVARPHDPTRLTRIFVVLNSVSSSATKEEVTAAFFGNENAVVNFFVNNVLLQI